MTTSISLRRYLSFQLGLVLVIQAVIVTLLAWQVLVPRMRADIGVGHQALARAIAGEIAAHILGGERQLSTVAAYIEAGSSLPVTHWTELLDIHCGDGELFETIYLADFREETIQCVGLARMRRGKRDDLIGLDLSSRDFLRTAKSSQKAFWSETFLSTSSSRMAVAVTIPLSQRAITGEITVEQLSALIRRLPVESGFRTIILDRRGRIVADSRGDLGGQLFSEQQFLKTQRHPDGGYVSTPFELDGRRFIGTIVDVDPLGWKVLVAQPYRNAYEPIRSTFLTILLGLFLAIVLALGFAWFQSNKLARNFRIYSDQAHSIAQGNYDLRLPAARTREFAELADTLQQMALMIGQRERQVVENERNLKITLDSIGDGVIATDVHGDITRMNPLAERLTGWSFARAAGKPLSEVFHIVNSQSRGKVPNPVERVLAEGAVVGLANHTLLIAKDGSEYQIADSAAPIRQADGGIMGVVMVFRDVTEIYAKEQKIHESERLLKNLTANVPVVVFQIRVKPDGFHSIDVVNKQISQIFGLDVATEEIVPAFIAGIPEEEKEALQSSIIQAVRNVSPWHWEGRYHKPSGETIWFAGSAICQAEGEDTIIYGFLMETTERKQWESALRASERRFKDLFNEAPVMYVITENRNLKPYVRDVNNLFVNTLGYHRQEVIGTALVEYYTEASRREVLEEGSYQRVIQGEFIAGECSLLTRDGRTIHTLLHTRPEYDDEGKVVGTRAMFLDISGRKRAEQETERLTSALLQSQKMEAIGTLAGGIAHDFNNILAAVIGYSELSLKEAEQESRLHRNLDQILVAGLRARDLVQQILTFSRQEERELKPLQIGPLIREALKLLRSSLPSTIEIHHRIAKDLDNVLADPTQIHRIIMNLCTNAAHAMEESGGIMTVSLSQVALTSQDIRVHPGLRPGKYVKFSVQDTGPGIAPEIKAKIFDPYFSTKSKGKGTGLGLSVVHGIVNKYGGAIFVYSEPGRGTLFNVYIPAVKSASPWVEPEEVELPTGSEHILLVDDDPMLTEVGQLVLEMLGYKVTACDGSLAALEIFHKAPGDIDLVISDVTMPKMTGDKLAREMLRTRGDLPIILCTGFSDRVSDKAAAEIGVKAIVMKPFAKNDLAFLVRKILDEAQSIE